VKIQRFPNLLRGTVLTCRLPYPGGPKSASDCCFLFGGNLHPFVTGSAATLVVSRLQSSLRADFALMLRPASWLALLSRTFTFELSLAGSPRANLEYDYVGKQSIPTTGLSPASPTALWAAEQRLTPRSRPLRRPRRHICLEGFDGFVSSTIAPIASGWSDPHAGQEFHLLKTNTFNTARTKSDTAKPQCGRATGIWYGFHPPRGSLTVSLA
jgi:hypothetical protein